MKKSIVFLQAMLLLASISLPLTAEEASVGVVVPVTITGGILGRVDDVSANFRALISPALKLGANWSVYSVLQVSSRPSTQYGSYDYKPVRVLQGFLGRAWTGQRLSATVKVGQLASAFGSFPLRYDDMANPLPDQPLAYRSRLRIRPDQLPCGVNDLARQWKNYQGGFLPAVRFGCGGDITPAAGMLPVTLYGLPGLELDISSGQVDARAQLTNSSPANPLNLLSASQRVQWALGAGYTIRPGFRVGLSTFRGPYLDESIHDLLPIGETAGNYPATGVGVDMQWAKGRWSADAEWQRFQFNYPRFLTSPSASFGHVELKAILAPRLYAATRLGYQQYGAAEDDRIKSDPVLSGRRSYEFAVGYRPNRWQLLKVGYQRLRLEGGQAYDNVLAIQLVTSIESLSKSVY